MRATQQQYDFVKNIVSLIKIMENTSMAEIYEENVINGKISAKWFRWDLWYFAIREYLNEHNIHSSKTPLSSLNNNHVDTCLRKAFKEVYGIVMKK